MSLSKMASRPIDQLYNLYQARMALSGLLLSCEASKDVHDLVEFHQLGHLLDLLNELEGWALEHLEHQLPKL